MPLNPRDRFICLHFAPTQSTADLSIKIDRAISFDFRFGLLPPISILPEVSSCTRRCFDTGLQTELYWSLYSPADLLQIIPSFEKDATRELIRGAEERNFFLLADFVWKHLVILPEFKTMYPKYFGDLEIKEAKQVDDYSFDRDKTGNFTKEADAIIKYLKAAIDLLLNSETGYGFSGLRVDAVSNLHPNLRLALYQYIRETYPGKTIFEEALFDKGGSPAIAKMAADACYFAVYSDFVTSNLYYQKAGVFGELPNPSQMGDLEKIKLANGNGIGFTGNHDHFSAAWGIILNMAAVRVVQQESFMTRIGTTTASPRGKGDLIPSDKALEKLQGTASGEAKKQVENYDHMGNGVLRYLLPFANEIARELLDPPAALAATAVTAVTAASDASDASAEKAEKDYKELLSTFRLKLFEAMSNRTMASMSGYFVLESELVSIFETQRIFSNKHHEPLRFLMLTIDDLEKNIELTKSILKNMSKDHVNYPNFGGFAKNIPSLTGSSYKAGKEEGLNDLRIVLPFIIEYLRNNPEENKYPFYSRPERVEQAQQTLIEKLGFFEFVKGLNRIFSAVTTLQCSDYHTFMSQDQAKIIVRCSEQTTDVIILNLNPSCLLHLNDIDLEKIALWFQTRLYPQNESGITSIDLSSPFEHDVTKTKLPEKYFVYWRDKVGTAFDDSSNRIVGDKADHQTNLYLGYNIDLDSNVLQTVKITRLLSKWQEQIERVVRKALSGETAPVRTLSQRFFLKPASASASKDVASASASKNPASAPKNPASASKNPASTSKGQGHHSKS